MAANDVVGKSGGGGTQTTARTNEEKYINVGHRAGITGEEREAKLETVQNEIGKEKGEVATATNPTEKFNSRGSGTQVEPKSSRAPDHPDTDRGGAGLARDSSGEEETRKNMMERVRSENSPGRELG